MILKPRPRIVPIAVTMETEQAAQALLTSLKFPDSVRLIIALSNTLNPQFYTGSVLSAGAGSRY